jgi:hypothetical protein
MSVSVRLWVFYQLKTDGSRATGLTVTLDVDKYHRTTGVRSRVETGVSAVEGANGVYSYTVANVTDIETYDYVGVFMTAATTVVAKDLPSLQQDFMAALSAVLTYLDAAVSTRLAATNYSAAPTAEANADAVWDELIAGHTVPLSTGVLLATAGAAADPLLNAVPGSYPSGSAGWRLGTFGTGSVTIVSPVADDESITIFYGDDYLAVDGRALDFTFTNVPTLTAGAIALIVQKENDAVSFAGTVTGAAACRVELTSEQVNSIGVGEWRFDLQATLSNGHSVKLVQSIMMVAKRVQ